MKFKIEVNDNNFEKEVIEKSKNLPVIVDFWAEWCSPCKILKPLLEKLAEEYNGKFLLAKYNVDKSNKMVTKYSVSAIPSVKFFKDGKIIDEFVGAHPEEKIRKWIEDNLK